MTITGKEKPLYQDALFSENGEDPFSAHPVSKDRLLTLDKYHLHLLQLTFFFKFEMSSTQPSTNQKGLVGKKAPNSVYYLKL